MNFLINISICSIDRHLRSFLFFFSFFFGVNCHWKMSLNFLIRIFVSEEIINIFFFHSFLACRIIRHPVYNSSSFISVTAIVDAQPGILGRQLRGSLRGAQEGSYEAAVKGNYIIINVVIHHLRYHRSSILLTGEWILRAWQIGDLSKPGDMERESLILSKPGFCRKTYRLKRESLYPFT